MTRKNIGFLSYWGWGRGQAYLTLCHVKMIQNEHNVFIMKQFPNKIEDHVFCDNTELQRSYLPLISTS